MALSMNFYDEADGRRNPCGADGILRRRAMLFISGIMKIPIWTQHFYTYSNGEVRNPFVDPKDGLCKASKSDLLMYSDELGCAEIALAAYGLVFVGFF